MDMLMKKQLSFYKEVGIIKGWKYGIKGKRLKVAIIDSGISKSDFFPQHRLIDNINLTTESMYDTVGHGSHVAGLLIGEHVNNINIGILPEAKYLIIKIIGEQQRTSVNLLVKALNIIIEYNSKNSHSPIDLVNISLGNKIYSEALHNSILELHQLGAMIVSSSGNYGDGNDDTNEINYPGVFCESVQIGSIDIEKKVSHFSNSNINLDFVSLGNNVISNSNTKSEFKVLNGTSMSTAIASGILGMFIENGKIKNIDNPIDSALSLAKKYVSPLKSKRGTGHGLLRFNYL